MWVALEEYGCRSVPLESVPRKCGIRIVDYCLRLPAAARWNNAEHSLKRFHGAGAFLFQSMKRKQKSFPT